jgi:hypothetical protein
MGKNNILNILELIIFIVAIFIVFPEKISFMFEHKAFLIIFGLIGFLIIFYIWIKRHSDY